MRYLLISTGPVYGKKPTGGMLRFKELSEYYNRKFKDTVICGTDTQDDIESHNIKNYISLNEKSNHVLLSIFPPVVAGLTSNIKLYKKLKKEKPTKVIIFDVMNTIGPALLGFKNIVLMIRKDLIGYEKLRYHSNFLAKWLKLSFQWLCESICMIRTQKIICQCVYDREVLRNRHPLISNLIAKKTAIQINNVNPSWIVEKSKIEGDVNIGKTDMFRVCFIGGFDDPRKGQDIFLESATQILNSEQNVEFILVGGGNKLDAYKAKYNNSRIIFVGRQNNPISFLKDCDLLVVPSLADSCPNTVMEALYNSVAVIGSKAGGIPEILVDEDSLFILKTEELTRKIVKLMNDNEALAALRLKQEKRRAELWFDWSEKISGIIG